MVIAILVLFLRCCLGYFVGVDCRGAVAKLYESADVVGRARLQSAEKDGDSARAVGVFIHAEDCFVALSGFRNEVFEGVVDLVAESRVAGGVVDVNLTLQKNN